MTPLVYIEMIRWTLDDITIYLRWFYVQPFTLLKIHDTRMNLDDYLLGIGHIFDNPIEVSSLSVKVLCI